MLEFGTVATEVKFFGSLVDSSEISASELTMSLMKTFALDLTVRRAHSRNPLRPAFHLSMR